MSGQEPVPARDPGVQPERTRLAWRRTTLTYVVSVGLAARTAAADGGALAMAAVGLGALAWLGFLFVAHRRIAGLTSARPAPMGPGQVRGTVACVLLLVLVGVMLL